MKELLQANIHYLRQAAELVDALEDGFYARPEPMFYNSSVGGHLRHCLEHYESFIQGAAVGKVDYDARARDMDVEHQTLVAKGRIEGIISSLEMMNDQQASTPVQVKMDCGGDLPEQEDTLWQQSTMARELQFLVSHTVHHFAMIRWICQGGDVSLDSSFGVAPSTLRYQQQEQVVAAQS